MKEVAEKLIALIAVVESKINDVNAQSIELADKLKQVAESERKLSAATSDVNARQRVLDKQQLSQESINKAIADVVEYKKIAREANELSDKLKSERITLNKEKSDLESMKEVYRKKAENMKIAEANLESRKNNLRQEIFEELKGKLTNG